MKIYIVYILVNRPNGIMYVGITSDLKRRITEHKLGVIKGFTQKYNLKKLVYIEQFEHAKDAIKREKQLKHWHRKWKFELIEKNNLEWDDLAGQYFNIDDKEYNDWVLGRDIYKK